MKKEAVSLSLASSKAFGENFMSQRRPSEPQKQLWFLEPPFTDSAVQSLPERMMVFCFEASSVTVMHPGGCDVWTETVVWGGAGTGAGLARGGASVGRG